MFRFADMKLVLAVLVLVMVVGAQAQWYNFPGDAIGGLFAIALASEIAYNLTDGI